jgi:hypothetical protein
MKTPHELFAFIESDPGLLGLQYEAANTLADEPAHDLDHGFRVAEWICRIGGETLSIRNVYSSRFLGIAM